MQPEEDAVVADGPCAMLPTGRSREGDAWDEAISKHPPSHGAKHAGGRSPTAVGVPVDGAAIPNERVASTVGDNDGGLKPSSASHPSAERAPATSNSNTDVDVHVSTVGDRKGESKPGNASHPAVEELPTTSSSDTGVDVHVSTMGNHIGELKPGNASHPGTEGAPTTSNSDTGVDIGVSTVGDHIGELKPSNALRPAVEEGPAASNSDTVVDVQVSTTGDLEGGSKPGNASHPATEGAPTASNSDMCVDVHVSTAGGHSGELKPGNASHPATEGAPTASNSDTGADPQQLPQYRAKLPVSPRRADALSDSENCCKGTASGEVAIGSTGVMESPAVGVNRHVASMGGTAVPKAAGGEDKIGAKGVTAEKGRTVQNQTEKRAKQGEHGSKKWPASLHQPTNVVAPPKPKVLENGSVKSRQLLIESIGAALAERERDNRLPLRDRGLSPKVKDSGLDKKEGTVAECCASELNCSGDPAAEGSENLPTGGAKNTPPAPVEVRRVGLIAPGAVSSDSEHEDVKAAGPRSPRVVRATALSQRSRDRETPRSSLPRSNSHRGGTWTISTPIHDRNVQTYTRRRRGVTMTSMEQEVAGTAQSRPFRRAHTVGDAFNLQFDSRDDQNWQGGECEHHLTMDSPFRQPLRSSNPTSEVSGVSEYSGYDFRESASDASSRPGSLGLGRFSGHPVPQFTADAWNTGHYASSMAAHAGQGVPGLRMEAERNHGISDGSTDMSNGVSGANVLSYQQLQVHQGILQSPKGHSPLGSPGNGDGQTGSDATCSWGDDYGLEGGRPVALRQRALERMMDNRPRGRHSTDEPRYSNGRDDSSEYNSACGTGRRRSIGGKILQAAVFGVAGVAALVFGGELIKATAIEEDDDRNERY